MYLISHNSLTETIVFVYMGMGVFTGALIDAPKVYINQYSHIYHRNVFIKYITSYNSLTETILVLSLSLFLYFPQGAFKIGILLFRL